MDVSLEAVGCFANLAGQDLIENGYMFIHRVFQTGLALATENAKPVVLVIDGVEQVHQVLIGAKRPEIGMQLVVQSVFASLVSIGLRLKEPILEGLYMLEIYLFAIATQNIRFYDNPYLEDIAYLPVSDTLNHYTALRNKLNEVFLFQTAYGFANRRAAYAQFFHEIDITKEVAGGIHAFHYSALYRPVRQIFQIAFVHMATTTPQLNW